MITNVLRGGIGNMLFQIAAGYSFAYDRGLGYGLDYNAHVERGQGDHISTFKNTIFKKLNILNDDLHDYTIYKELNFSYDSIPHLSEKMKLDGYFQSEKYFPKKKNILNDLFGFNIDESCFPFEQKICCVQVRLGDYLRYPVFNVITPQYIYLAMNKVRDIHPDIKFIIVSDDENLAMSYIDSTHIQDDRVQLSSYYDKINNKTLSDLRIMSVSDYCIISNSSFGWWGSYLGKTKPTIIPSQWFNNDTNTQDIIRNEMEII